MTSARKSIQFAAVVVALLLVICFAAQAQQGRASLFGTVTDPSGAGVPKTEVVVQNTATGQSLRSVTSGEGYYSVPALPIGEYTVSAEAPGFKKLVRSGVRLQVDQRAQIDLTLEIGAVADSVQVTAEAPLVNTGSGTLGQVIDSRRIADLPINGRNAFALVLLSPGVKNNTGPTASGFGDRWAATNLSINGGTNAMNAIAMDGADNVNPWQGETAINPMVDSVAEFKVQTLTVSAEFGFTSGGAINVVTKSGTNSLHGTLYEFVRNDAFDARNTFAATKPVLRYNQFGASAGGPILKNRTFFFANWEEYRFRRGSNLFATVPTARQRTGDFSDLFDSAGRLIPVYDPDTTMANPSGAGFIRTQFAGNVIPSNRLDPVALKVQNEFYPLPNRPPTDPFTNANNYQRNVLIIRDMTEVMARVDHRFSDRNNLFGRITYYKPSQDGGGSQWGVYENQDVSHFDDVNKNRNYVLADTHVFSPRLLNEFRVSVLHQHWIEQARSFGKDYPQQLGLPSIVPGHTVPRFNNGLPIFAIGYGDRKPLSWQFQNTLTRIQGAHTLKFGVEHRIIRAHSFRNDNPSGVYNFSAGLTGNPLAPSGTGSTYASYLLGAVASATINTVSGQSHTAFATSAFVQDDWKATRRLTLNLGLRYDVQKQPVEMNNGYSNFDPTKVNPINGLQGRMVFAGVDGEPRNWRKQDYNDFGPRLGFAYDLLGNGSTVLRGAFGMFYPSIYFRTGFGSGTGFANATTSYTSERGGNYPAFQLREGLPYSPTQPLGSDLGPSAFLGQALTYDESDGTTPRSMQWGFSLQRQLPGRWLLEAAYSANRGRHFMASEFAGYDMNQLDPQYLSLGLGLQTQVTNPYAGMFPGGLGGATIARSQLLRPFPYYGNISVRSARLGNFQYDALLLTVQKPLARGFTMLFSYTAGKKINDGQDNPTRDGEGVNENAYQNGKFARDAERAIDPADTSQRAVVSAMYDLPFGRGKRWSTSSGLVERVIGGWQINTIGTMQTGNPVVVRGATNNLANRPNSTGTSAKLENPTRYRWFDTSQFVNPPLYTYGNVGRVLPDVRSPGTVNWDLSVVKNTAIWERVSLQFRAEAFNFLNQVNLGNPNGTFVAGPDGRNSSATFGTITSARDARVLQFGLKLI